MSGGERPDTLTLMAMWGSLKDFGHDSPPVFEGPEKRLEIIIRFTEYTDAMGLRCLDQSVWDNVVGSLNATIVSKISNDYIDSYVLTESSLFVMSNRIVLITCGTTTLLKSLSLILDAISQIRAEVEWASFMRKNFSYPWEQKEPHSSMENEYNILKKKFPAGKPFVFGPVDSDHYFFYSFDDVKRPCVENDTQMSMTMYGLSKELTRHLFSDAFYASCEETEKIRNETGMCRILDGWTVQDLQFKPCGYSVNAIRDDEYQTMHITPEDHCSFASYETNSKMANLSERLTTVLGVFKPKRFTVIVVLDPQSAISEAYRAQKPVGVEPENFSEYYLANRTVNEFEPGHVILKLNYVMRNVKAGEESTSDEKQVATAPASGSDSR